MIFVQNTDENISEMRIVMKRKFRKSPNIYLAIFACLIAVGASAVTMLRDDSSGTVNGDDFTRVTVDWKIEEKVYR